MLKHILLALVCITFAGSRIQAQNYKTAIGLRLSSNDANVNHAVSVKHFVNPIVALEALAAFDPAAIGVLAEVHQPISSAPGLRGLFGCGGYIAFKDGGRFGAQGILGIDYKFLKAPINLTADWKPELNFTNNFQFEPAAVGLSVRFSFK